jgi:hypothetical protein
VLLPLELRDVIVRNLGQRFERILLDGTLYSHAGRRR